MVNEIVCQNIKRPDKTKTLIEYYLLYLVCSVGYEKAKDKYPDDEWTYFYGKQASYFKQRFFELFQN